MTQQAPETLTDLLKRVRQCQACQAALPCAPRPIIQLGETARLLIAGQAPGAAAHQSGIPFDDASGARLRDWLGVDRDTFQDATRVAILPMGFCYPGKGRSGDLPPRPECAPLWRRPLLEHLRAVRLTLVIGNHARKWHLSGSRGARGSLTEQVRTQDMLQDALLVLPHPSPRNNIWLARHRWFERSVLPQLRQRVRDCLTTTSD